MHRAAAGLLVHLTLAFATVAFSVGGAAPDARADAIPMGMRGVGYKMSIDNLKQFPNHVFIVYPTSNNGYGYVFEAGKPITNLFMTKSWREGPTRMHAMKKADFESYAGEGRSERHPHGDNEEMVQVVPRPSVPPALVSTTNISPPGLVPEQSSLVEIERVYHIKALTDKTFDLVLVEEVAVHKDGKREKRKGK